MNAPIRRRLERLEAARGDAGLTSSVGPVVNVQTSGHSEEEIMATVRDAGFPETAYVICFNIIDVDRKPVREFQSKPPVILHPTSLVGGK